MVLFFRSDDEDSDEDLEMGDFYQPFDFFDVEDEGYHTDDDRPRTPAEDWDDELDAQDLFRELPFDIL